MYLILALISAILLGLYDIAKKQAVTANAVMPVLALSTLFSSIIFLPPLLSAEFSLGWCEGSLLSTVKHGGDAHLVVWIRASLSLASWILGYISIKHLPITIVGTINATRPVMVLVGAIFIFGDRLNAWQWSGVILSFLSLFLLSKVSEKEGIKFTSNRWILLAALSALFGAAGGLYDKYAMSTLDATFVMGWNNIYQTIMMIPILAIFWYPKRSQTTPFKWSWWIVGISIFLSAGDFCYLSALGEEDGMVSVVNMVRRSSVIVSFLGGALMLKEKNIGGKLFDLLLIIIGMILIFIGS